MMDLELPPPGLQSQQVLPRPSGPSAVPGSGQELEGTVALGGRDGLSQDYDGRAWELPRQAGRATENRVASEPEVARAAGLGCRESSDFAGQGSDTATSLGERWEGVDAGGLNRRRPAFSGAA